MRTFNARIVLYVIVLSLLAAVAGWTGSVAAVVLAVLVVAGAAYLLSRNVESETERKLEGGREELEAGKAHVQEAVARFGKALAATHDPYALLPVLVESAVAATGAPAARLLLNGVEIASAGEPDDRPPLEIPLEGEDGVLLLTPPREGFSDESRELAEWLASQAAIALENARLHRQVERQAATDVLTDLPNRRLFEESLAGEISRVERFGGSVALILADLDDFKQVNDRYGHQSGDDVLRAFADVLRANVRAIDLPSRYGGEEFAVLLPQTDLEGAARLAERLREAVAARPIRTTSGTLLEVTASFGVASYPPATTPAALFGTADDALYRAKRSGKNCVMTGADAALQADS